MQPRFGKDFPPKGTRFDALSRKGLRFLHPQMHPRATLPPPDPLTQGNLSAQRPKLAPNISKSLILHVYRDAPPKRRHIGPHPSLLSPLFSPQLPLPPPSPPTSPSSPPTTTTTPHSSFFLLPLRSLLPPPSSLFVLKGFVFDASGAPEAEGFR